MKSLVAILLAFVVQFLNKVSKMKSLVAILLAFVVGCCSVSLASAQCVNGKCQYQPPAIRQVVQKVAQPVVTAVIQPPAIRQVVQKVAQPVVTAVIQPVRILASVPKSSSCQCANCQCASPRQYAMPRQYTVAQYRYYYPVTNYSPPACSNCR